MAIPSLSRQTLMNGLLLPLLLTCAGAQETTPAAAAGSTQTQESVAGVQLASLKVPAETMARRCVTMVSPLNRYAATNASRPETVIVQAVISKSGRVAPVRVISGDERLADEAMNAVRLWRYKAYMRDGEPVTVTTEISVHFTPGDPGGVVTHPGI